ncbi:hypothetical protein [Sphingomonas alpina]|uniref:Uncharacterized protein n=1 Tax=Sphingomonas alpina TaxID=653931 RepID=A0A7H0LEK2_9SPHN|nr:hypothetical protein [Sphingomonas alpina]QNQ08105.1 hypothetical protein H3Z74_15155 [Sphingomonas alpina]
MTRRFWPRLRLLLITAVIAVLLQLVFTLTGFGNWVHETPAAIAAGRVIVLLFCGGGGLFCLVAGRYDPEMRTFGNRLTGIFLLLIAAIQAALLFRAAAS